MCFRTALALGQAASADILDARWRLRPDGYLEGVHVEQIRYYTALRIMTNQMLRECDQEVIKLEAIDAAQTAQIQIKDRVIDQQDKDLDKCYDKVDVLQADATKWQAKARNRGKLWWIIAGETIALGFITYTLIR